MNLDDELRRHLQSSYSGWEPEAPPDLPASHRSHTPLIAGAAVSTLSAAGLVVAVVFAGGSGPAPRGPAGAQALDTTIPACRVGDAKLVVRTDKPTYVQQPADPSSPLPDRMINVTAELVPTSSTPCRLFIESGQLHYLGPSGQVRGADAGCLAGYEKRYNRTGPTPAPATDGPWCAAMEAHRPAVPSPTESPTDPGENDDYGLILATGAPDAGGARESEAADDRRGRLSPEPSFGSVPVEDSGNSGRFDVGRWSAELTYGPWSASASFEVTPSG